MFCAITGASQGLGQAIAVTLAKAAPKESYFILVARNEEGLEKTKSMMVEQLRKHDRQNDISINIHLMDLYQDFNFTRLFQCVEDHTFTKAILINNAGSLGDVSASVAEYDNADEVKRYYNFNMVSPICLTSAFLAVFLKNKSDNNVKCTVINISSLAAIEPCISTGLYCSGKAGRLMLFRVLAMEEPKARVLNYSPGPLQGDMAKIMRTQLKDEKARLHYKSLYEDNKLVNMYDTASKLAQILEDDKFESGAHIDYYDDLP